MTDQYPKPKIITDQKEPLQHLVETGKVSIVDITDPSVCGSVSILDLIEAKKRASMEETE